VAETVRLSIKDMQIEHRNSAISHVVTLSLGVASMRPTPAADSQMLVDLADAGLYAAKQQGRDRAVFNCVKSHH
jgi:diguanylate cyclase (GGDEF)-like protein